VSGHLGLCLKSRCGQRALSSSEHLADFLGSGEMFDAEFGVGEGAGGLQRTYGWFISGHSRRIRAWPPKEGCSFCSTMGSP
jgi:hypothetical protein